MYSTSRYSNDTYRDRGLFTNREYNPRPRYRPPDPLPAPVPDLPDPNQPANFKILLYGRVRVGVKTGLARRSAVTLVIRKCCSTPPKSFYVPDDGPVEGRLFFTQWTAALNAVVSIWETRLSGLHNFTPVLKPNVHVPSDVDELNSRLRPLFSRFINDSLSCETMRKCQAKKIALQDDIRRISECMRKQQRLHVFADLDRRRKRMAEERRMLFKWIAEFEDALECIDCYINDRELKLKFEDPPPAFQFTPEVDWARVYSLVIRERRRFEDGLPMYMKRRELLKLIQHQQIMVLVGETGSGKSTQLVQFLADSGVIGDGSIVCTQPRKIAAISLNHRVQEESHGCYEDDYISCFPYYSSARQFKSSIIYMTDHCLLQHCMNDENLKGISCVLVDEAHERSLHTDLLLAMLKRLLPYRPDLRLIIMSATADAKKLSDYFFGCEYVTVAGRKFPVDVKYVPCFEGMSQSGDSIWYYVSSVVNFVAEIHKTEQEGTILAFLSSQIEVERACENFKAPNAEPLAFHGKLSYDQQLRVFKNYPGKRKIIFATNVAETSLTIPGVKFVVDSGMMKETNFDPASGMNVLKACWVSQSSANQRAGRAGRTEPGYCYRLYSQNDFNSMAAHQKPEIMRVHLGIAVLKIVALGVKNVRGFDFIDSPESDAIDKAIQNLLQLRAVILKNGVLELTEDGRCLVKLGIEPRLGKLILSCFSENLWREGLVLAAVMPNSGNIFCRIGNQSDKLKSDCLKVPFCHADGDLFTLLSVYKAWENEHPDRRSKWCLDNSINAKSMRRCHDTVLELENCLKNELQMVVPSYWNWTPHKATLHHKKLKKAILASLAENVAMFSGCDRLGYMVALSGKHVQLHPSCSLLMFNNKAEWVVFSEFLDASYQYLACVTAVDRECLSTLTPPPLFDPCIIEKQKLQLTELPGLGKTILKKFCGKSNNALLFLLSRIRENCRDDRIRIEVDVDDNTIQVFSCAYDADKVSKQVKDALGCEKRWLLNECMERCLYHGSPSALPPVALLGSGAEIKHLELDKRSLTVDVFYPNKSAHDDKELLLHIENHTSEICSVHKSAAHGPEIEDPEKWGSITFLSPDAAIKAAEVNDIEFNGCKIRLNLSRPTFGMNRAFSFPVVRAKLFWPRRLSKGLGIVKCDIYDVGFLIRDLSNLLIGKKYIRCEAGKKSPDSVVITGIDRLASETEILQALRSATDRTILDFFLVREDAVDNPPCHACEEVLFREISAFMPKGSPQTNYCRVRVFSPNPKHAFMKALVTFDGRLYFEAAKALEQIEGTTLPGFQPWQKIQCERLFHTSVSCPSFVYSVIKGELDSMVTKFNRQKGAKCIINKNTNGSVWVRISATATKTVAEIRKSLEELMKGRTISHPSLTPDVLHVLFSRNGNALMRALEQEMEVSLFFDRQRLNLRLFGPSEKAVLAEEKFIRSLVNLHEEKRQEIHLRGVGLPHDLMREVVRRFGHDLHGLKDRVPNVKFSLDTRRHVICTSGSEEAKQKVEEILNEIAQASGQCRAATINNNNNCAETCPICFCKVEDPYCLDSCLHVFCKSCLVEQCESAIRNKDSFPINCLHEGCKLPIVITDFKEFLSSKQLDDLFEASVAAFVSSSCGAYRFCPSPDCPSVYKVADPDQPAEPFLCGACYAETCPKCHLEYHPNLSCDKYKEYKEDPDASLKEWTKGKDESVKKCPGCGYTIEKIEGCNHVECRCGRHLCWVCLEHFLSSEDCYSHLRTVHQGMT